MLRKFMFDRRDGIANIKLIQDAMQTWKKWVPPDPIADASNHVQTAKGNASGVHSSGQAKPSGMDDYMPAMNGGTKLPVTQVSLQPLGLPPPQKPWMPYKNAIKLIEEHVKKHNGEIPNTRTLSKIIGCSRPTVDKAISNSLYLTARKAESRHKGHKTVSLTDNVTGKNSDTQDSDAQLDASIFEENEVSKLIAEQKADERRDLTQSFVARRRRPRN